jgi:transcriptional regulator with XRE-family HTH domain
MKNNTIRKEGRRYLDLLSLHREGDRDPRSWIIVSGENLNKQIKSILDGLLKNHSFTEIFNEILLRNNIRTEILDINFDVGKNLKDRKIKLGITQKKLCELTGTSGKSFRLVEEGKHFFTCKKLNKISKILGEFEGMRINCNKEDLCLKKIHIFLERLKSNKDIPIVLMGSILDLWKERLKIPDQRFLDKKLELIKSIDTLKLNQHCSEEVKSVNELNMDLSKIIGSFCTDGSLTYPDQIRWEEEHLSNMQALSKWISNCFKEVNVFPTKRDRNSFSLQFRSKVITRYLTTFFDIKPGYKTDKVRMPELIRNSSFHIKKSFVKGCMTFEGSVDIYGKASFGVISKRLTNDVYKVISKEISNIRIVEEDNTTRKDRFGKETMHKLIFNNPIQKEKRNLLSYFEEDTVKWMKLKGNLFGFNRTVQDFEEIRKIFKQYFSKVNKHDIESLLKLSKRLKYFDVYDVIDITKTNRSVTSKNLNLFVKFNILKNEYKDRRMKYHFNDKIFEWRLPDLVKTQIT